NSIFSPPSLNPTMRWIALFGLVATASSLPRSVRNANYAALAADVKDDDLELVFATALWRHGDRAADHAVPGREQFPEDAWTFGGGGYGELSPEGMAAHFNLGKRLRARYMDKYSLLSPTYNAKEIYIRSTDYNRTLISAYANVAGMYAGTGVTGQNFPAAELIPDGEWPVGYIPIPVHTVPYSTDFVGHPDSTCARQDELYALVQSSAEYQNYINDPQIAQILVYLSNMTGTDVTIENIGVMQDPIYCEQRHITELNETGATIEQFYPWFFTNDIPEWADWIDEKADDFADGIANPAGVNGIDVSVEIPKIRAGDSLKLLSSNVKGVLACRDNSTISSCRKFYENLKYYAISAHDSTLLAFLSLLGVKQYIIPAGGVNYTATMLFEVYEHKETAERSFKVLYHASEKDDIKPITSFVRGCSPLENVCSLSVLDDLVAKYAPETDMATLCNTPVFGGVDPVTGTVTSPTNSPGTTESTMPPTTSAVSALSLLSGAFVIAISTLRC
ncbi:hypothetical protein PFISCL1PPCAC_5230, partial [Pristionchus fissidentatus]